PHVATRSTARPELSILSVASTSTGLGVTLTSSRRSSNLRRNHTSRTNGISISNAPVARRAALLMFVQGREYQSSSVGRLEYPTGCESAQAPSAEDSSFVAWDQKRSTSRRIVVSSNCSNPDSRTQTRKAAVSASI